MARASGRASLAGRWCEEARACGCESHRAADEARSSRISRAVWCAADPLLHRLWSKWGVQSDRTPGGSRDYDLRRGMPSAVVGAALTSCPVTALLCSMVDSNPFPRRCTCGSILALGRLRRVSLNWPVCISMAFLTRQRFDQNPDHHLDSRTGGPMAQMFSIRATSLATASSPPSDRILPHGDIRFGAPTSGASLVSAYEATLVSRSASSA
jgi:hypothetical protein